MKSGISYKHFSLFMFFGLCTPQVCRVCFLWRNKLINISSIGNEYYFHSCFPLKFWQPARSMNGGCWVRKQHYLCMGSCGSDWVKTIPIFAHSYRQEPDYNKVLSTISSALNNQITKWAVKSKLIEFAWRQTGSLLPVSVHLGVWVWNATFMSLPPSTPH